MLKAKWDEATEQIEQDKVVDLAEFEKDLNLLLQVELTKVVDTELQSQSESVGVGFDPTVFNEAAREWAKQYSYDLVRGITEKTHDVIADAVSKFTQGNVTRGQLQDMLEPAFNPVRADSIAVTEVTRAYSQAQSIYQDMLGAEGVQMERVWNTDADDIVCPICRPLNGKAEDIWQDKFPSGPPAHVNCRCGVSLRIKKGA